MLQKFYNEKFIRNSGEFNVSQLFDDDFLYDDLDWYVFHSYPIAHHVSKVQGECDFLVVSQKGILIIEVKGGIIHYKNNEFYFPKTHRKPEKIFKENPFEQADGNKFSLIKYLHHKDLGNCWVQSCVAFPDSPFDFDGIQFENFYHLNSKGSFYNFVNKCLDFERPSHKKALLSDDDLKKVIDILSPSLTPSDEEVRIIENLKRVNAGLELNTLILEGLYDNPRLLMQGPPGSGKSMYGKAYALKKCNEGKKGLFLTFNLLLADKVKHSLPQMDVFALWPFFEKELIASGIEFNSTDYKDIEMLFLEKVSSSQKYDFIVVDEAQDLFSPALEKILTQYIKPGKHHGEFLILYDLAQAFSEQGKLCFENIKNRSAHFKLLKNFRAAGSEELESFIEEAYAGHPDFDKAYLDIEFVDYPNIESIPQLLINHIHENVSQSVFEFEDMVVLNNTDLYWKYVQKDFKLIDFYKKNEDLFDVLDDHIDDTSNKISVTTPLKFKGLEKPVVYLLIDELKNHQAKTYLQFLIGISRAQSKLIIFKNKQRHYTKK